MQSYIAKLAIKMLGWSRYLDVLSVPRAPEPPALGTFPSWVPDWSIADFTASLRMPSPSGMALLEFQATPIDVQKFVQISTDRITIGLAGEIVDHVVEIGGVHSHQAERLVTMAERLMRIPKRAGCLQRLRENRPSLFWWAISTDRRGPSRHILANPGHGTDT
jgi:hypothetical protein